MCSHVLSIWISQECSGDCSVHSVLLSANFLENEGVELNSGVTYICWGKVMFPVVCFMMLTGEGWSLCHYALGCTVQPPLPRRRSHRPRNLSSTTGRPSLWGINRIQSLINSAQFEIWNSHRFCFGTLKNILSTEIHEKCWIYWISWRVNIHFADLLAVVWRTQCLKISVEVTVTALQGWPKFPLKSFSQIGMVKLFWNFAHHFRCQNVTTTDKIIWRNQFLIHIFIKIYNWPQ